MERLTSCCLLILLLFSHAESAALSSENEKIRGWVLGEKCVKTGKLGECYLKWAYPMVLWTEGNKTYRIKLAGKLIDEASMDNAFGKEVEMEGTVSGESILAVKITLLGAEDEDKEFFRG